MREAKTTSGAGLPVLTVENLAFSYGEVDLFSDLSFSLEQGESKAIVGSSGSGKTTLIHLVAGLLNIQKGQVFWQGQVINGLTEERLARKRLTFIGLVFQHHYLQAELTALENVMIPGYLQGKPDPEWGQYLLERVGVGSRAKLYPSALSGGERQRVAVARALFNKPQLLLADEPTGSLDRKNANNVLEVFLDVAKELGTTILLATHDERIASVLPELRLGE